MKTFIYRCAACSVGIIVSHPLDILKLRLQTKDKIKLFAGIEAPLILNSLTKGIRFHIFSVIKPYSLFIALVSASIYNGIVESSVCQVKLQRQLGKKLYPGGGRIIFIKEIIGTSLHLFLYHLYVPQIIIHKLFYGGLIAVIATSVVYPSDRFFINYKTRNMSIYDSIKENKLWEGYYYIIMKSFIGYSITTCLQSYIP